MRRRKNTVSGMEIEGKGTKIIHSLQPFMMGREMRLWYLL
jgi:hypothetical protein